MKFQDVEMSSEAIQTATLLTGKPVSTTHHDDDQRRPGPLIRLSEPSFDPGEPLLLHLLFDPLSSFCGVYRGFHVGSRRLFSSGHLVLGFGDVVLVGAGRVDDLGRDGQRGSGEEEGEVAI